LSAADNFEMDKVVGESVKYATELIKNARAAIFEMKTLQSLTVLLLILATVLSCRMAETLTGSPKAGTVSSLWPDVPAFAGAQKADLEIPLGARLAMRAMMQGKVNFIAFTTDKSAEEVKGFYSNDRMKSVGWIPNEKGCIGDTQDEKSQGAICLFSRKDGGKDEGLAIIVAENEKTRTTEIFYARIDLTRPSPSPSTRTEDLQTVGLPQVA
jgi:hypothetical protein